MEYLKKDLEGLMEGGERLLQERIPHGEKVIEEAHGDNKRNVNHDFIESKLIFKTHHIPNINMRKFDQKDLITWIPQMEKYYDLHSVKNTHKVHIASLYLKPN